MIKLHKLPKPPVLVQNEQRWTNDYSNHPPPIPDSVRFRYRQHPEIKKTIRQETHDKCAYCESKTRAVHPGEVDHIRPVSKNPQLILNWENLTFVCHECNTLKGSYDDPQQPLLHPYNDEPEDHIFFAGPMAVTGQASLLAKRTIALLNLNRAPLLEERKEKLQRLQEMIDTWRELPESSDKRVYHREILKLAESDSEYAAAARFFLQYHGVQSDQPPAAVAQPSP